MATFRRGNLKLAIVFLIIGAILGWALGPFGWVGGIFILIGLQLPVILSNLGDYSKSELLITLRDSK